jgi:hypothetical protein
MFNDDLDNKFLIEWCDADLFILFKLVDSNEAEAETEPSSDHDLSSVGFIDTLMSEIPTILVCLVNGVCGAAELLSVGVSGA